MYKNINLPDSEWPQIPCGIWKMAILIHMACSWFAWVLTSPLESHKSLKSNVQISEYNLPPSRIRKTNPEAICTTYGHNSKWQVHITSKNPKWVQDSFSFRPVD